MTRASALGRLIVAVVLFSELLMVPGCARVAPIVGPKGMPIVVTVLELASILSAAKTAEEAGVSVQKYWNATTPPGESVYSVAFNFDHGSWADILSKPDIYLMCEYEGGRTILVPDIAINWDYSERICTFRCPTFPEGAKCVIRLYDDDSTSDAVWKDLLSNEVHWNAGIKFTSIPSMSWPRSGVRCLDVNANANGTFSIIDPVTSKQYHLDPPDIVATAQFTVPSAKTTDIWKMNGDFYKDNTRMGRIDLKHWYTNRAPVFSQYVTSQLLFWGALSVAFIVWRLWLWHRKTLAVDTTAAQADSDVT